MAKDRMKRLSAVPNILNTLRVEKNMSQRKLAELMGLEPRVISKYESNSEYKDIRLEKKLQKEGAKKILPFKEIDGKEYTLDELIHANSLAGLSGYDLIKLSMIFDVSVDYLLGLTDYKRFSKSASMQMLGLSESAFNIMLAHKDDNGKYLSYLIDNASQSKYVRSMDTKSLPIITTENNFYSVIKYMVFYIYSSKFFLRKLTNGWQNWISVTSQLKADATSQYCHMLLQKTLESWKLYVDTKEKNDMLETPNREVAMEFYNHYQAQLNSLYAPYMDDLVRTYCDSYNKGEYSLDPLPHEFANQSETNSVSGSGLERTAPDSPLDPKDFMSDDDFIEHLTQVSKELLHDGLIIE